MSSLAPAPFLPETAKLPRIMFVDDEQYLLDGIRDALRPYRRRWEMHFAPGGAQALARLEEQSFDVVVSDLRMPTMDGAVLLEHVRERSPGTVRIVLSGQAELRVVARAAGVAHQLLAKPCAADRLAQVISRACEIREMIVQVELNRSAVMATRLPAVPSVYTRLAEALGAGQTSAAEIATIVEQDVAISAKILQLANSAYYSRARAVTQIEQAVVFLGRDVIQALVLQEGTFSGFKLAVPVLGFDIQRLQTHCVHVGQLARAILAGTPEATDAFTAGLLHDVGLLVLAAHEPAVLEATLAAAVSEQRPIFAIERETCGVTHAEVGAYLLALWGLPFNVTSAVQGHQRPPRAGQGLDETTAVYVANILMEQVEAQAGLRSAPATELDIDGLGAQNLLSHLPSWQERAAALLGAP